MSLQDKRPKVKKPARELVHTDLGMVIEVYDTEGRPWSGRLTAYRMIALYGVVHPEVEIRHGGTVMLAPDAMVTLVLR